MIESIRIMGHQWRIYDDTINLRERTRRGECHHFPQTIALRSDIPGQEQSATLLHEIMHAASEQLGVALEEEIVIVLSLGLFAVLRDNPEVARHITAGRRIVPKP